MRVLIVDDSVVFRSQIKAALEGVIGIEVVGVAANGRIALAKLEQVSVDVVTLDMEMPEMNGLETLKQIRSKGFKTRVVVFSSQTQKGAALALEALRSGADDVVAKPEGLSIETAAAAISKDLVPRLKQFERSTPFVFEAKSEQPLGYLSAGRTSPRPVNEGARLEFERFRPSVVVIASSTGGPSALETIFGAFQGPSQIPILIVQHMPPVFTQALADRIQALCGIPAAEARNLETLLPNRIYVAPGNFHMSLGKVGGVLQINLDQSPHRNSVRPAADKLFETAAEHFKSSCAAFVLTGMGEDGRVGVRAIKAAGGKTMIQARESCVVFGMPGAVFADGNYDAQGDLNEIATILGGFCK